MDEKSRFAVFPGVVAFSGVSIIQDIVSDCVSSLYLKVWALLHCQYYTTKLLLTGQKDYKKASFDFYPASSATKALFHLVWF